VCTSGHEAEFSNFQWTLAFSSFRTANIDKDLGVFTEISLQRELLSLSVPAAQGERRSLHYSLTK
jgi:hypothetical protein